MICNDRLGEFLIELITYADDKDIKTFLRNCSKIYQVDNEDSEDDNYYNKTVLLDNLFKHIYYFIVADKLTEKGDICIPLFSYVESVVEQHTPLYLHLYALCNNYYSYMTLYRGEKKKIQTLIDKINKQFNKNYKINSLTVLDRTKLLCMLINNYTENKFYYYYDINQLVKLEIVKGKAEKSYNYKFSKYNLIDRDGLTDITDKHNKKISSIRTQLIRDPENIIDFNKSNFIDIVVSILNHKSFQDIKQAHQKIVAILKRKPRTVYCGCCNPNPKNYNMDNLCDKCRKLFFQLNSLKKIIDDYDANEYILSVKSQDFKKLIEDVTYGSKVDIKDLKRKRKNKLNKIIKKLEAEIQLELIDTPNDEYYIQLNNIVKEIKISIKRSFDDLKNKRDILQQP